jgi:hypothetical protein
MVQLFGEFMLMWCKPVVSPTQPQTGVSDCFVGKETLIRGWMEWLLFLSLVCDECGALACLICQQRDIPMYFETGALLRRTPTHMIVKEAQTHVAGVAFFHNIVFFHFVSPVCLCTGTSYIIVSFIFCCHNRMYSSQWSVWKHLSAVYPWLFCVSCLDLWLKSFVTVCAILKYAFSFLISDDGVEFESFVKCVI